MSEPEYREFPGLDGTRVLPVPAEVLQEGMLEPDVVVEQHYLTEGARHARLVTREALMAAATDVDLDLSGAVQAFRANSPVERLYAEGLSERLAFHAAEVRGVVVLRQLDLPLSFSDPVTLAADLPLEWCDRVASTLEDISGQLAVNAGIEVPERLREMGWVAGQTDRLEASGTAARSTQNVQRARAAGLAQRLLKPGIDSAQPTAVWRAAPKAPFLKGPGV